MTQHPIFHDIPSDWIRSYMKTWFALCNFHTAPADIPWFPQDSIPLELPENFSSMDVEWERSGPKALTTPLFFARGNIQIGLRALEGAPLMLKIPVETDDFPLPRHA